MIHRVTAAIALVMLVSPAATHGQAPSTSAPVAPAATPSTPTAATLPPSPPGNIELSAELLEVDVKQQSATLSGHVVLTRGTDLAIRCSKIDVRYDPGAPRVSWARGTGGIVADIRGVRGEGPEFELDLVKQRLVLRGGVRLYRGQGWVAAEGADIDLATYKIAMTNVKASLPVGAALKKP